MRWLFAIATLAVAVAGGIVNANASVPLPVIEQTSGGAVSLAAILKQIMPSVVGIAIKGGANAARNSPSGKGERAQRAATARNLPADRPFRPSGSGVMIDPDLGIVLTNAHVINGADEIVVTFADGQELPARRVGSDPATDIAVIQVQAIQVQAIHEQELSAVPIGNSDQLEVGDFVLAIGNPFQIGQTVTSGIVSALHRNNLGIERYEDFIQTDAAIYPGNSGGPLINLRGQLIGISTAYLGDGTTHPGMGFAIPSNLVRSIADQIVKNGEVRRARSGVMF